MSMHQPTESIMSSRHQFPAPGLKLRERVRVAELNRVKRSSALAGRSQRGHRIGAGLGPRWNRLIEESLLAHGADDRKPPIVDLPLHLIDRANDAVGVLALPGELDLPTLLKVRAETIRRA